MCTKQIIKFTFHAVLPLVIKYVCGIFVFKKKLKRRQGLCALPLDPQLQYWKFFLSRDFEYPKFLKSFLLFIIIEED